MSTELLIGSCAILGLRPATTSDLPVEICLVSTETGLKAVDGPQNLGAHAIASLFDGTNWTLIPTGLNGKYSVGYLYALGNCNRQPDSTEPTGPHPEEGAGRSSDFRSYCVNKLSEQTIDRSHTSYCH